MFEDQLNQNKAFHPLRLSSETKISTMKQQFSCMHYPHEIADLFTRGTRRINDRAHNATYRRSVIPLVRPRTLCRNRNCTFAAIVHRRAGAKPCQVVITHRSLRRMRMALWAPTRQRREPVRKLKMKSRWLQCGN